MRVCEVCLWRSPLFWWHLSSSSQPTLPFVGDKHCWVPGTHYCQLTLSTDPCRMTHVKVKSLHLPALCFVKQAEVFVPQQERGSAIMGVYLRTNIWVNGEMQAGYGLIALARKRLPPADLETVLEATESTESPDCQEMWSNCCRVEVCVPVCGDGVRGCVGRWQALISEENEDFLKLSS